MGTATGVQILGKGGEKKRFDHYDRIKKMVKGGLIMADEEKWPIPKGEMGSLGVKDLPPIPLGKEVRSAGYSQEAAC